VGGNSSGADVEINEVLSGIDLGIFPATNHIILWGTVSAEAKMPEVAVQTYDGKWLCATQEDGKLRCRFDGCPLRIGHHEIRAEIIFPVSNIEKFPSDFEVSNGPETIRRGRFIRWVRCQIGRLRGLANFR
jgi:hypothetical protein